MENTRLELIKQAINNRLDRIKKHGLFYNLKHLRQDIKVINSLANMI